MAGGLYMIRVKVTVAILAISLISSADTASAGTISYSYDTLGRLVQVTYPNGAVIQYIYDANGNRTTYIVTGSPNTPPPN